MRTCLLLFWLVNMLSGAILAQPRSAPALVSPLTHKGRVLSVGYGGGVAGRSVAYYLLDNGRLFGKRRADTTFVELKAQSLGSTKQLFRTLETSARIRTTRFNEPGNTYRFVGWQRGRTRHRVVWGQPSPKPPAAYPRFYTRFMALIPDSLRLR